MGKGCQWTKSLSNALRIKRSPPFATGKKLINKEITVALSDLSDAKAGYENGRYKWSTIQAYYAMFHASRALVYAEGDREKSHYCLAVALRVLFVDEGRMDAQSARDFLNAMNLREEADYNATFSQSGARAVMTSADKFIRKAIDILDINK